MSDLGGDLDSDEYEGYKKLDEGRTLTAPDGASWDADLWVEDGVDPFGGRVVFVDFGDNDNYNSHMVFIGEDELEQVLNFVKTLRGSK